VFPCIPVVLSGPSSNCPYALDSIRKHRPSLSNREHVGNNETPWARKTRSDRHALFHRLAADSCCFRAKVDIFLVACLVQSSRCFRTHEESLTTPTNSTWNNQEPDPKAFLATAGRGKKVVAFLKDQTIFARETLPPQSSTSGQGESDTLWFRVWQGSNAGNIERGRVLGYCGLAGQPLRTGSATAITDCRLLESTMKK